VQFLRPDRAVAEMDVQVFAHVDVTP